MYLCSVTREGLGFWVIGKLIGFLPFWIYSEVERERERIHIRALVFFWRRRGFSFFSSICYYLNI